MTGLVPLFPYALSALLCVRAARRAVKHSSRHFAEILSGVTGPGTVAKWGLMGLWAGLVARRHACLHETWGLA